MQSEHLNSGLPQTIVAMITGNPARSGPAFRIAVPMNGTSAKQMGLLTDSVIMLDHVVTILDREIDRRIGACPDMGSIDAALRIVFGL